MSIGDWMITILLTFIPLVGFIMLIVWAAGGSPTKPSRKNWAIAQLIWAAILIGITILFSVIIGGSIFALLSDL